MRLVRVVSVLVVIDGRQHLHLAVRTLHHEEVNGHWIGHARLEDELIAEVTRHGVDRVLHVVVDARFDHPLPVEGGETAGLVVKFGDEIIGTVRA